MSSKDKFRRIGLVFFLFSMFFCLFFYSVYSNSVKGIENDLRIGLKLASISLNTDDIQKVNNSILSGASQIETYEMKEYKSLVKTLNKITDNMTVKSQWSYLIYPASIAELYKINKNYGLSDKVLSTSSVLSVLTVPFDPKDSKTEPGTIFDMKDFPAMFEATKGPSNITVSNLVYDSVYKTWNRGGFIKIRSDDGKFIGVLGTEVPLDKELSLARDALILGGLYSLLFALFFTFLIEGWRAKRSS